MLILFLLSFVAYSQIGTVIDFQKISDIEGNFSGELNNSDAFNRVTTIGDLDNDNTPDLAVGAFWDDDGSYNAGAVWILFMNPDLTVKSHQKISKTNGNFGGAISESDAFGYSVCNLGDLDGDEIEDIAVGSPYIDYNYMDDGAIWILFLNANGTVKNYQLIANNSGGFPDDLDGGDFFGINVSNIGDFDNDGVTDIVVGSTGDQDGQGPKTGAFWILCLNSNGTVKSTSKVSDTQGGFTGGLNFEDRFGRSCASIGDLDSDGITDLMIGAITDDDGGYNKGACWILFMNANGTVKSFQKISDTEGNFTAQIDDDDQLGQAASSLGDIDGDGVMDVMISAHNDDDGDINCGATYILFLNTNGTVKSYQKISSTSGNFAGSLNPGDTFGAAISFLGDMNNDGLFEIGIGAAWDDDGGTDRGAIWIVSISNIISSSYYVDIKAFLQGPFAGTIMSPLLNIQNFLPLAQPYNVPPWNYYGSENVSSIPSYNIVDWVLIEIRESTGNAYTATSDSTIARISGFILVNGKIVGLDGSSLIPFNHQVIGNLYALIFHRNHLAIMSSSPLLLNGNIYEYDFTTGMDKALGGILGQKYLGNNQWGMFGGDADGNGVIHNLDKFIWKSQTNLTGYMSADFDMNGQVQTSDKLMIWHVNTGRSSQIVP